MHRELEHYGLSTQVIVAAVCLYRSHQEDAAEGVVGDGVGWSAARRSDNDRLSVEQVRRAIHCLRLSRRYTQRLRPTTQPPTISARRTQRPGPHTCTAVCFIDWQARTSQTWYMTKVEFIQNLSSDTKADSPSYFSCRCLSSKYGWHHYCIVIYFTKTFL